MWKEFLQISRDVRLLIVVLIMPSFMLLLFGYAINLDVKHLRLAIYDQDCSSASRDLAGAFSRGEYFDIVAYVNSYNEATAALDNGRVQTLLVIPATYSEDIAAGRECPLQLIVDGSDSTTANTALGYLNGIIQQKSASISLAAIRRAGVKAGNLLPIEARFRYCFNPELKSTNFLIPGLIAAILMMLSAMLTSVTVVRERERGTIESLVVSPVMPFELMLGKLVPYVMIAFFDVLLVMTASVVVFKVPLKGDPLLVILLSGLFLIAALGIGLLISTVAKTQQLATAMAMMGTQLPSVMLSGFIFPISSMPQKAQWLTYIIPATHFIKILRAIFLKGSGFSLLWQPSLILFVIGLSMLLLCSARFKKEL
jgi:ABC-2 type transport system permease protein